MPLRGPRTHIMLIQDLRSQVSLQISCSVRISGHGTPYRYYAQSGSQVTGLPADIMLSQDLRSRDSLQIPCSVRISGHGTPYRYHAQSGSQVTGLPTDIMLIYNFRSRVTAYRCHAHSMVTIFIYTNDILFQDLSSLVPVQISCSFTI